MTGAGRAVAVGVLLLGVAREAGAVVVPGGGSATRDCVTVFDATPNTPSFKPRNFRCVDGDSSCDADETENGVCEFAVAVCGNSTAVDRCTPGNLLDVDVDHADDNGDPKFDPDYQALQQKIESQISPPTAITDRCTTSSSIFVKLRGPLAGNRCFRRTKILRLTSRATGSSGSFSDRDTMRLTCLPAQSACLPQVLFDGTFDRIQDQIFTQTCAVSSCHDSQTTQAGLLLEEGAAYANLVNVTPTKSEAANLGWKRVKVLGPTSGDPDASFLFHKVEGSLTPDLGNRMPFARPPLNAQLIEIIRLWILAGAPATGWVPGTDS